LELTRVSGPRHHHVKAQVGDLGLRHEREGVTGGVYRLPFQRPPLRVADLELRGRSNGRTGGRRLPSGGDDERGELVGCRCAHPGK
jgi:hypothetical protein